jgi:hypothetical protein
VRKLVVATTAGADDAMPARREKAIFGFLVCVIDVYIFGGRSKHIHRPSS